MRQGEAIEIHLAPSLNSQRCELVVKFKGKTERYALWEKTPSKTTSIKSHFQKCIFLILTRNYSRPNIFYSFN